MPFAIDLSELGRELAAVLAGLQHEADEHGIGHATFQPETVPWTPLVRHG